MTTGRLDKWNEERGRSAKSHPGEIKICIEKWNDKCIVKTLTQDDQNDGGPSYSLSKTHIQELDDYRSKGYTVWINTAHHGYHRWGIIRRRMSSYRLGNDGHYFKIFYPGRGLSERQFSKKVGDALYE
jgi:hypothetical protein